MAVVPSVFSFSAEYPEDHPAFDEFDDYLRIEFAKRHPGWEPRFGKVSVFDPIANRYNYRYLLMGNVPDASSHEDAQNKVHQLVEEISEGVRSLKPRIEKGLPKPLVKVWKHAPG
jgi:hypothetical protein